MNIKDELINKMWLIYTEYYLALKRKEILIAGYGMAFDEK